MHAIDKHEKKKIIVVKILKVKGPRNFFVVFCSFFIP